MLSIRGKRFAPTKADCAKSKADGFFRVLKYTIDFYDATGELFASLVQTHKGTPFFVSVTRLKTGKWYSYALSNTAEQTLGIAGAGYREKMEIAANVASEYRKRESLNHGE